MSKRRDTDLIQDILESINRINTYTENISFQEFANDYKSQDAVVRNLEILGEAVKLLSTETKEKYAQIPWKDISGTRDRLIHEYFGVNIDIVWDIIKNELSQLIPVLNKISAEI
ncbi:MAG: hypothetical protein DAHOPDDO_01034 [Ignavibacteriaceae bacterium]|nr:hypothetical protein [Ignavibacteriaceae bacterium]